MIFSKTSLGTIPGLILPPTKISPDTKNNMKHSILLTAFSICIFSTAFAQPQKVVADKIIGVVGNKIVLKSDIDNSLLDMQRQGMELPPDARCLTTGAKHGYQSIGTTGRKRFIAGNR